jgi:hypothetical protein
MKMINSHHTNYSYSSVEESCCYENRTFIVVIRNDIVIGRHPELVHIFTTFFSEISFNIIPICAQVSPVTSATRSDPVIRS